MSTPSQHAPIAAHPPKPRLTLVVGVTGHRLDKLNPDAIPEIERGLKSAFAAIDLAAERVLRQDRESKYRASKRGSGPTRLYADAPAAKRLVVEAADGTDQIAIACRPADWLCEAVLPFPRSRYRDDFAPTKTFDHADRRPEFDAALAQCTHVVEWPEVHGIDQHGRDPYEIAGTFLLRQVDVLIAVWDGAAPRGPGGTGALAARAIESNIPVLWIASDGQAPPARLRDLNEIAEPWRLADATLLDIDEIVRLIAAPASARDGVMEQQKGVGGAGAAGAQALQSIARFYGEVRRLECRRFVYDVFSRLLTGRPLRLAIPLASPESKPANWTGFFEGAAKADPLLAKTVEDTLLPRYLWADALGVFYANAYRSAYLEGYLLSTLAIAVALLSVFPAIAPEQPYAITIKLGLAFVEIVLIARVIFVVWRGTKDKWHERWLEYRTLAEHLRHLRFLSFVGAGSLPRLGRGTRDGGARAWIRWYISATLREIGLPSGRFDADYQEPLLAAISRYEIADQLDYNGPNGKMLGRLHGALHRLGDVCFFLTLVILVLFLIAGCAVIIGRWLDHPQSLWAVLSFSGVDMATECGLHSPVCVLFAVKPYITYFAAVLPALGAAFAGIRFTGDFEGFAQRSAETFDTLSKLTETMRAAAAQCDMLTTTRTLEMLAQAMAEDISQWESLYSRKELALPA